MEDVCEEMWLTATGQGWAAWSACPTLRRCADSCAPLALAPTARRRASRREAWLWDGTLRRPWPRCPTSSGRSLKSSWR